ncbi:MAG: DUF1674 domain-containing protein [Pseudomonadota bacterium]|nr:DUF1674 domain-containing protein [Pseudomonadota bacterium]
MTEQAPTAPHPPTPDDSAPHTSADTTRPGSAPRPREIGGRAGAEPTRYGDWELRGRCIDF